MVKLDNSEPIGIVGAGTMGSGIAQVAAKNGHIVKIYEVSSEVRSKAQEALRKILDRLAEKGKFAEDEAEKIFQRIHFVDDIPQLKNCDAVIEAIIENLELKQKIFCDIEKVVSEKSLIATNTSSLSITSIASACKRNERVLGIHFFNPAPILPLVEIIPGLATSSKAIKQARKLIDSWGKTTVLAKDTPGFIVNRIARPFYSEAIRLLEEGVADVATIDWAMKEIGGFKMGPFELMDLIGNDVNLKVTETVWEAFFYDPRFKPSFTQKRIVEAEYFGKKSGRGYYEYHEDACNPEPEKNHNLGEAIFFRILVMLINEAFDAVFMNVATVEDIELAMTKGVNYPKGLLKWAHEIGLEKVLKKLEELQEEYGEDRYRPNPLLRRMVRDKQRFFD
ncbi:MAG: 3-hydroxybutyryl-CoA dehydrogenase [Desulfobacterales bacterium SG8_35_2]|nr:MAG: 3-hydroxybutyryl-CoA dehydrogenase [Desulfobacterales bacterium SG8_35_2]